MDIGSVLGSHNGLGSYNVMGDSTGAIAESIAQDKELTNKLLAAAAVPAFSAYRSDVASLLSSSRSYT